MLAFTHIFSRFYPEIDIARGAFEHPPARTSAINQDFVTYALITALHCGGVANAGCTKFSIFHNSVTSNAFISDARREEITASFAHAQRCYAGLCRLARHWKLKNARVGSVEHDLYMNPLENLPERLVMDIFDDASRTIYKFRISDLMSIAKTALCNSPDFFADPQEIRNPYTNVPFTHAQLYTIYLRIRQTTFDMPILFSQYYRAGFDMRLFCEANECYIRDAAITSFVATGSDPEKYYYITKMLRDHRAYLNGVSVHPGFPPGKLIEAFSRYLENYLLESYSLNPGQRYRAKHELQAELARFGRLNPTYGRKVLELDDAEFPDSGRPEFRTAYIQDVVLDSPRVTPRTRARRRARALSQAEEVVTPDLGPRVVEVEPPPNEEEATQRAEAGAYRAARELERAEEAMQQMQEVAGSSAMASNRTIRRLEYLRESITQASNIVSRLARDGEEEAGAESEDAGLEEARRRPLPDLPTANLRAIMARYRRSRHPASPELTERELSPPLVPPPPPEDSPPPSSIDAEVLAPDEIADPEVVAVPEEAETTAVPTEDEI